VQQKKMFKVLAMLPKKGAGGGTYWARVGTGFTNRDNSVNIYLDLIPKNFELQLREYDEEDLRKRDPDTTVPGFVARVPMAPPPGPTTVDGPSY